MITIYACSSNPGKLREFALVATEAGSGNVELVQLPGLKEINQPDETGDTFEANAGLKAKYYSEFTDRIVLADDSGLEVDALGCAPGVYSARYATPHLADRHEQDAANNALLLKNMADKADRSARFVCAIALAQQGRVLKVVRGWVEGQLLTSASGTNGFGYDPLFFYPPFGSSFAELDGPRKFAVSHRGMAVRLVLAWLTASPEAFEEHAQDGLGFELAD